MRYYHVALENIYTQDFVGAIHSLIIGPGRLKADIRVFGSRENDRAKVGKVDNLNVGAMFSYQVAAHTFGLGYMHQTGDTAMAYIA